MLLHPLINDFVSKVKSSGKIELYNAAGLRHELASFLEWKLPADRYGIQVEREAQAVVLEASHTVFQVANLDVYIFERAGKGQFCLQILAQSHQNPFSWAEALKQVKFLEQLSSHGFQECGLFFACQRHAFLSEQALKNSILGYAVKWEELLPASQDNNGPWKYFFILLDPATKI